MFFFVCQTDWYCIWWDSDANVINMIFEHKNSINIQYMNYIDLFLNILEIFLKLYASINSMRLFEIFICQNWFENESLKRKCYPWFFIFFYWEVIKNYPEMDFLIFFPNMVITRKRIRGIFRTVERLTINYFRKKAPS